jgi:hypothetical protein
VQEAYRIPNSQDQERNTPRHIIIKTLNKHKKGKILKAAKEKRQIAYKGTTITANFTPQTLYVRRSWKDLFQALKENNCQPRQVYPANDLS